MGLKETLAKKILEAKLIKQLSTLNLTFRNYNNNLMT